MKKYEKTLIVTLSVIAMVLVIILGCVGCQNSGNPNPPEPSGTISATENGGTGATSPSTEATKPSTGATEPSTEATKPSTEVTEPSTEATEPSTEVTEPSEPVVPPTTEPTEKPSEPTVHEHNYYEHLVKATCTTDGYVEYACMCGDKYTAGKIPATGHKWGEWTTVEEPTESETGLAGRNCTVCGELETKVLDKLVPQHTHKYTGKVTKAATCSKEGVKTYTCSCGSTYTEAIAKTAHSYKSTVTAPTCTAKGYTTYKCSSCGDTYKADYKDAKGHSYTSKVTKAATCTAEGTKTFTCSCGSSYTEKIAKTAHKYVDTVTKPTCTKEGYTTHKCSVCGNSYTDAKKAATGHSYTSKVTTEATCEKDGVKTYTCSKCGDKYTEAIEGSHSWKHVHTDEVGHVEVWLVCRCGWTCTPEDAEEAGVGSDYDDMIMYWDMFHVEQGCPVYEEKGYSSYDTPDKWVVDTPASDKWVCTECGKETTTKP